MFCKVRTFFEKSPDFFIPCPALFEKSRHQLLVPWQEQENEKNHCIFAGVKYVCLSFGFISLALGIIGIFLPVLPTTPFLLLSATLFFRSSPRMYAWLMGHRHLGPYIRSFREDRAIPLRAKILSVSLVWLTLSYSAFFLFVSVWMRLGLLVVALGVTCYILSFKTRRARKP